MKKYYPHFLYSLFLLVCLCACNKPKTDTTQNKQPRFIMTTIPADIKSPNDKANYLVKHYWDHFDFADTTYINLPKVTEQAMADYIEVLPHVSKDSAYQSITNTLVKSETNKQMNAYFINLYERFLYDPNSPLRNEEFYIAVLDYIIGSSQTDETAKERADFKLKMLLKNRIGNLATNFTYTLPSGKTGTLYGIKSQYVMVFFYNPDCRACTDLITAIKASDIINERLRDKSLSLLSFYPDADLEIWKKHFSDIPVSWINGYDKHQEVQNKRLYDLKAIPTIYLLDANKRVILKDTELYTLQKFLTQTNQPPLVVIR